MIILILFAFIAGIATILAPCILPIIPVVLSAGVTGGKRRPLGIIAGLVVSFTFFTLTTSYLVKHLGLSAGFLRTTAILILLIFGIMLLVPKLLAKFEVWVSSHLPQQKGIGGRGDFWGGVLIGLSLGLIWTPCVGPIMASVIALAATSAVSLTAVFITLAYVLGTSIPLLAIMYGGKKLLARIKNFNKYTVRIQQIFGGIMVITAVGMLFGLDQTIQADLLAKLPSSISAGVTQSLEESGIVQNQLKSLRGSNNTTPTASQIVAGTSSGLPVLGVAPDFTGISNWINSSPLTIASLKGKVVLVDFWTYSCINCLRTLPHTITWYNTYASQGFVVVGVHSPEFEFEKDSSNVEAAVARYGIKYPVAQDNDLATWNAYNNQYWPAEYLIDAEGRIREETFGEGNYTETESNIRALLKEAKVNANLPSTTSVPDLTPSENQSPETYLGTNRQSNYVPSIDPTKLAEDQWTLKGAWNIGDEYITTGASGDSISYNFIGTNMYMVLNSPTSGAVTAQVLLDGKPIGSQAGADVQNGVLTVNGDRLYNIAHVSDPSVGHLITITFQGVGVQAYTYTFG